jgi:hypothetical protein
VHAKANCRACACVYVCGAGGAQGKKILTAHRQRYHAGKTHGRAHIGWRVYPFLYFIQHCTFFVRANNACLQMRPSCKIKNTEPDEARNGTHSAARPQWLSGAFATKRTRSRCLGLHPSITHHRRLCVCGGIRDKGQQALRRLLGFLQAIPQTVKNEIIKSHAEKAPQLSFTTTGSKYLAITKRGCFG